MKRKQHSGDLRKIEEKNESSDSSTYEEDEISYQKRLDARIDAERQIIKKEYEKRMNALSCCHKLYLSLRKNWVVDILFRQSDE